MLRDGWTHQVSKTVAMVYSVADARIQAMLRRPAQVGVMRSPPPKAARRPFSAFTAADYAQGLRAYGGLRARPPLVAPPPLQAPCPPTPRAVVVWTPGGTDVHAMFRA